MNPNEMNFTAEVGLRCGDVYVNYVEYRCKNHCFQKYSAQRILGLFGMLLAVYFFLCYYYWQNTP